MLPDVISRTGMRMRLVHSELISLAIEYREQSAEVTKNSILVRRGLLRHAETLRDEAIRLSGMFILAFEALGAPLEQVTALEHQFECDDARYESRFGPSRSDLELEPHITSSDTYFSVD